MKTIAKGAFVLIMIVVAFTLMFAPFFQVWAGLFEWWVWLLYVPAVLAFVPCARLANNYMNDIFGSEDK